jgi:vacuolar-type H+-ATPase subunit I/STV1
MDTRTLKKIYQKLSQEDKTNLETQKVDLAIVDDIKGSTRRINDAIEELKSLRNVGLDTKKRVEKEFKDAEKLESKIKKEAQNADQLYAKASKIIQNAAQSAKALGISPNNIEGYSRLEQVMDEIDVLGVDMKSFRVL